MKNHFFIQLILFSVFTGNLPAQTPEKDALQWLQQHQDALAYRVQRSDEGGYLQESFHFLIDKIVERIELYGNDGQLLSADEQDWFYREFQPADDINSLAIDTTNNGKLCMIRISTTLLILMSENGETQGNALLEFGFIPGDSAAKQTVLQAIKAVMQLIAPEDTQASKNSGDIRKDYKMLQYTINQQKFPFPPSMGYRINSKLKGASVKRE